MGNDTVDSAFTSLTPASQAAGQRLSDPDRRALLLYAVANIFAGAERLNEGARDLLRAVCENLGADYGGLWLATPQSSQLQCEVTWHTGMPELEEIATISRSMALPDRVSLPTLAWASGNAEWIESSDEKFKSIPLAVRADLHHACFIPVRHGDEVLGVLEFLWRQPTRPDDTVGHMLAALVSPMGKFITRMRARQEQQAGDQRLDQLHVERAQLTRQIEVERARLQIILNQMPAGLIIAEAYSGKLLLSNKRAEEILKSSYSTAGTVTQYSAEDLQARTPSGEPLRNEDFPLARSLNTGEVVINEELYFNDGDGNLRVMNASSAPIRDAQGNIVAAAVTFVDITDRKAAERALESALTRTQELYETSRRIGLSRTMDEILAVLLNNPYLAHSSRASITVFDRPWNDDAHPPDSMEIVAAWNAAGDLPSMMGQRYVPEIEWLRTHRVREGSGYIADVSTDLHMTSVAREHLRTLGTQSYAIFPLYAHADWYGLLTIHFMQPRIIDGENIRHIQGLVDQVSVAIHNLWLFESEAKARKDAEQANALRLQFLAMISHELRTPLTSIKGFITTLLAEDVTWDPASQRDFLETANQETDRLRNLIEQLLDLSQLEARIMRIHPHEHPLLEMISNILQRLKAATVNHQLVLNISGNLPPVMADRRRIEQVLINLIDNAAKYSPSGTTITLSAHGEGDFVQVDVSDHGPGISAEERAYVFDAFRRGREENTKRVRGAGLGLSICRGIVEAHHGHIWIGDDDGSGTTISFTLPAARPPVLTHL